MPYIREGKCVYKKNADGSKGEKAGCSDSVEGAKKHMAALYANENKSYAEFSMVITKASIPDKATRAMRISMVNSDIGEDAYEERMSVDLFRDFVGRIEKNASVPEPFDAVVNEGGWEGGMPYLSISHYKSGNGANVPGEVEKVYVDGDRLKSSAVLHENPLGLAVWKSVCCDIQEKDKPLEEKTFENPVRISIGFLDLEHKHEIEGEDDYVFTRTELKQKCEKCEAGINGKVYLKGQLVHLAFTRVPANPRTQVEVLRMSDEIETKRDDAESIIGDLAEELVGKSTVEDDVMVVKADDMDEDEESRDRKKKKEDDEVEEESQTLPEKSEETMDEKVEQVEEVEEPVVEEEVVEEPAPVPQKSKVEESVENLLATFSAVKQKSADKAQLQPILTELVNALNEETADPMDKMAEQFRSIIREELEAYEERTKPELVAEVLRALPEQKSVTQTRQEIPTARSIVVNRSTAPAQKQELTEIQKLALRSVQQG